MMEALKDEVKNDLLDLEEDDEEEDPLPATQEIIRTEPAPEAKQQAQSNQIWGTLIPMIQNLDHVELTSENVRVGRDPENCDVVILSHHLPVTHPEDENMKIDKVSRVMFRLFRTNDAFGVEDLSTNGTFVNNLKVGKNKQQHVRDGDKISIIDGSFVVFTFISEKGPRTRFPSSLCDLYHMGGEVGSGSTCCVYLAWRRKDVLKVAVKVINKIKWPTKYSAPVDLMQEVNILKNLDHPGIVKVLDVVETNRAVNIVMEFAEGGELFNQVEEDFDSGKLNENVAKFQFYQICATIQYLHSMNVCHRDLKLENLLLYRKDSRGQIKVSDFGLSKVSSENSILETFVGTPVYMAPEIISSYKTGKSYSLKSDCWSLGVILYTLLSAKQPFNENWGENKLHKKIMSGNYCKMSGPAWQAISQDGKDLVEALLTVDPAARLSSEEILHHPWFTKDQRLCGEARNCLHSATNENKVKICAGINRQESRVEDEENGGKRAGCSSGETGQTKKIRVDTKEYLPVYVIDSDSD